MIREFPLLTVFPLHPVQFWRVFGCFVLCLLVHGCANPTQNRSRQASGVDKSMSLHNDQPRNKGIKRISRPVLKKVLGRSVGDLLRRYVRIEAVLNKGRFVGWRIEKIAKLPPWMVLRRGDVIRKVNGLPLAKPDDAHKAWKAVRDADEIRIDFIRNRRPHSFRIAVDRRSRR